MLAPSRESLPEQVVRLQAEVVAHKAAIRRHRQQLQASKTALVALEDECRRRGIRLIVQPSPGEGVIHGRPSSGS